MRKYTNELLKKVNECLEIISHEEYDVFVKTAQAINLLENTFIDLKTYISTYSFTNDSEEIIFFKEIKPQLFSKLIYYRAIYNIEVMRPNGSTTCQSIYLNSELERLKSFFDRNIDIYKYYRTGCCHLDKYYFMRGTPDIQLSLDSFHFERDQSFSTIFDFKIAKILANEMISEYLNREITKLENPNCDYGQCSNELPSNVKLTWTGKKVDLIEQIYAWEGVGCFNNGNVNIKDLTNYIEYVFNINLGDYYRTFLEMRNKKGNRTAFLDKLIKHLEDRMLEADNK